MKKSIISLCICGLVGTSSLSYAAANTNLVDMSSATARPKYEVSLGVLYLKPSSSNLDYAVLGYPFPVQSPHWDVQSVAPSNSFGFDLSGRYYIPNTDYDVAASWQHLYTTDSDFTQVGSGSGLFVVFPFQAGPSAEQNMNNASQKARSNVSFTYNVINLDVGKNVDFGSYKQMRFFIGLSGAQLQQNISTTFGDNADTYSINSKNVSKFNGIGPLIGIDGNCHFANGVGFFGTAAVSALVGNLSASTKYTSSSPTFSASSGVPVNYQSISPKDSTQGVPGIEGKFGVDYTHRAGANSTFTASLGYQYVTYFNAIATYNPAVVFGNVNTGSIALSSLAKTWSNYTVQGPFLNLGFSFA